MQIDEKGNTITRDEFVRVDVVFLSFFAIFTLHDHFSILNCVSRARLRVYASTRAHRAQYRHTQLLFFYEIFANEFEKFRLLVFLMASVDSVYKILFFLLLFGWKVHFYYDNGLMFSHSFKFRGILPIDNLRLRWISWASAVAILLRFPFLWHVSIQYRCKGKIGTHVSAFNIK